jgi:cysteine-rich repeat protein
LIPLFFRLLVFFVLSNLLIGVVDGFQISPVYAAACGDLILDPSEQCDDGNTSNGDGCSTICEYEITKVIFEENKSFESYKSGLNTEIVSDASLSKSGSKALKIILPDKSHIVSRLDLSQTHIFQNVDSMIFWIRTAAGTYSSSLEISIQYSGEGDASSQLNILPFVAGGVIDTTYRKVVIPSRAFVGNFGGSFRTIYIKLTDSSLTPKEFYIDNLVLTDTKGFTIEEIEVLDSKHLKLQLNEAVQFTSARQTSNYTITDKGSPTTIAVSSVGISRFVSDFGSNSASAVVKDYIYLTLSSALTSNTQYLLSTNATDVAGNLPETTESSFSFDFSSEVSSSIKINQVGYLPKSPKRVYVGNYLGDNGKMFLANAIAIKIINKNTKQSVYSGTLTQSTAIDDSNVNGDVRPFSGEDVWYFDFTNFETPGSYYAQVNGIGRSYDFEIGDSVFNKVFYTTARALFYQRSGMALTPQFAGIWSRGAAQKVNDEGVPISGYYHNSIADKSPELYDNEPIGQHHDFSGGWFDAGDYNRYIRSAAEAADNFLTMFTVAPDKFKDNQLNIPESGNGVPDILDEAKWEIDWIAKMVSSNGCAFNKVSFEVWSDVMPDKDQRKQWAITKSTADTALAAAILAKAAKIYLPYFPEAAASYKTKALSAWQCLVEHPTNYPNPVKGSEAPFCNPDGDPAKNIPGIHSGCSWREDLDPRAWAAIEMFALTGEKAYEDTFKQLVPTEDLSGWTLSDYYGFPSNVKHGFDYFKIPGADSTRKEQYLEGVRRIGELYRSFENFWPYQVAEKKDIPNIGFGTLSMSTRYSYFYILASAALNDPSYLENAKINLDFQLGANPLSKSFITGVGDNPVMKPLNKVADLDGIPQPIPGFTVYGPANSLPYSGYYIPLLQTTYPPYYGANAYPAARKYLDHAKVVKYGEYVVDDLTTVASVFGFFSSAFNAPDLTPPVSSASHSGGVYLSSFSVTLSANETANLYYCFGADCLPDKVYFKALPITDSRTLRFYASDTSGNVETTKELNFQINAAYLSSSSANISNKKLTYQISFPVTVNGFTKEGIVVSNGTVTTFSGSNKTYYFTVTPINQGVVKVFIPGGENYGASNEVSKLYDTIAPTVDKVDIEGHH